MNTLNIDEFISSSISANKEIYKFIKTSSDKLKEPLSKGFGGDVSIMMDIKTEEIFVKKLKKFGKIFSEESGEIGSGSLTIVIDPLDGSDNFKSNFPYFGSSVALKNSEEVLVGIVTNFATGDVFVKTKKSFKRGNLFDDEFCDVVKNRHSTFGIFERAYKSKRYSQKLKQNGIKYRVAGAFALSLAYAWEVDFVLFEGKVREFDVCAGRFMCEELFMHENSDMFLVAKDFEIFEKLRKIL